MLIYQSVCTCVCVCLVGYHIFMNCLLAPPPASVVGEVGDGEKKEKRKSKQSKSKVLRVRVLEREEERGVYSPNVLLPSIFNQLFICCEIFFSFVNKKKPIKINK